MNFLLLFFTSLFFYFYKSIWYFMVKKRILTEYINNQNSNLIPLYLTVILLHWPQDLISFWNFRLKNAKKSEKKSIRYMESFWTALVNELKFIRKVSIISCAFLSSFNFYLTQIVPWRINCKIPKFAKNLKNTFFGFGYLIDN